MSQPPVINVTALSLARDGDDVIMTVTDFKGFRACLKLGLAQQRMILDEVMRTAPEEYLADAPIA